MNISNTTPDSNRPASSLERFVRPTGLRRFSARHPLVSIVLVIGTLSALYLLTAISLDYFRLQQSRPVGLDDFGLFDWWVKERIVEVLIFWWVVAFGASVGSFLNVVVYRMPLGMSLSAKSSHCVWCKAKIYSRDNLPIIGWILLRGRCRKCRLPISSRYPLVETQTALLGMTAFILMVQLKNFGLGPYAGSSIHWHFWLMNFAPIGQLILYFYYFWLLAFCVSVAWIDFDRNRIPWKLVITSSLAALVLPALTVLLAKPYFQSQLMSAMDFRFQSPATQQYLANLGFASESLFSYTSKNLNQSINLLMSQLAGLLVGLASATTLCFLCYSAFPSTLVGNQSQDADTNDASHSQRRSDWMSGWMVFAVAGLFMGPVFVVLFATMHFLTSIVATPLLMNSRFSPLRSRWFLLPYSWLISILFWRWVETILIAGF